jgi:hypothetical protein
MDGVGIAEDDTVKAAEALGLLNVSVGNGWTMVDTVELTSAQRLQMGLPPLVRKQTAMAYSARALAGVFRSLVGGGAKRPSS